MATSGSIDFTQTRNEIIQNAYQLLGVYGTGRTINAADQVLGEQFLNMMIKGWMAKGLHLWAKEEAILFVEDEEAEYTLSGDSTSARVTARDTVVVTNLDGAVIAAATSLTVDDTTDMTALDIIGIVQDDDVVHWTTITSVDTTTTLTLTAGMAGASADNSNVYVFTSRINKPLRIHAMRRITGTGQTQSEIPMIPLSHSEYFDLPNKNQAAANPSHYYYNPNISSGRLYLWPSPSDPSIRFGLTYTRMLEDFDSAANTPDLPQEWLQVITYQLAVRLAPSFDAEDKANKMIVPLASILYQDMLDWDTEVESVYFQPDSGYRS